MKILLTAVNAKYIHSNLAVYSLKAYAERQGTPVSLLEFTINQQPDEILGEIYRLRPDVVAFSVYIWNVSLIRVLAEDIHKILPETEIWMGGPEVSWNSREMLEQLPFLRGILRGEGGKKLRRPVPVLLFRPELFSEGDSGPCISGAEWNGGVYAGAGTAGYGPAALSLWTAGRV